LSLRCVRSSKFVFASFYFADTMKSHKVLILVVLLALTSKSWESTISLDDGNVLEMPDEPKNYCGIELKRAIRKFCLSQLIETYKPKEPPRNFQKPSRCMATTVALMDKCCKNKCLVSTLVQFCPYRYVGGR
jgi:uncharacterized membrane protein